MASSAWRSLTHRPLIGVGPGGLAAFADGQPYEAHLTPLNVAAVLGLPALAGFLAIPLLLWRARGQPLDRPAWGAAAGLALDALAQDIEDFRHLWILFGWLDGAGAPAAPASPSPNPPGTGGVAPR